jgi:hypothetical protein
MEITTDAAELTMVEALYFLRETGLQLKAKQARLMTGTLSSLQRLCALRDRRTGIERLRVGFEERVAKLPQLVKRAAAVRVLHGESKLSELEPRLVEVERRAKGVTNALFDMEKRSAIRAEKLKRVGYAGIAIPEAAHDFACARYLRGRIELFLDEVNAFRAEMNGPVASPTVGHPEPPTSRAWHVTRAACMAMVRKAGGTLSFVEKLFGEDEGPPDPRLKINRVRKRLKQAKRPARPKG